MTSCENQEYTWVPIFTPDFSYNYVCQETIILRERNSVLMSVRCSWRLRLFLVTSPSRAQGSQTKEFKSREQTVPSARTSKIKSLWWWWRHEFSWVNLCSLCFSLVHFFLVMKNRGYKWTFTYWAEHKDEKRRLFSKMYKIFWVSFIIVLN